MKKEFIHRFWGNELLAEWLLLIASFGLLCLLFVLKMLIIPAQIYSGDIVTNLFSKYFPFHQSCCRGVESLFHGRNMISVCMPIILSSTYLQMGTLFSLTKSGDCVRCIIFYASPKYLSTWLLVWILMAKLVVPKAMEYGVLEV